MELFEQFGIDLGYVVIGMAAVIIILFILLLITMIKDANTRKGDISWNYLNNLELIWDMW